MARSLLIVCLGVFAGAAAGCGDGCDRDGAQQPEEPVAAAEPTAGATSSLGAIDGVVRLAAGAELPSYPLVTGSAQPAPPEQCSPPRVADRQPVTAGPEGALGGILIAVSGFDFSLLPERQAVTHRVVIDDCRLSPPFVHATRGDQLELVNETDYPFLPVIGGSPMLQALLQNESRIVALDQGGVRSIGCAFAAPCGRSDVVVVYHPLHVLTDERGRFHLPGVPAGTALSVSAWHPLFREEIATVTLEAGGRAEVSMLLTPAPIPEAEPAGEEAAEGESEPGQHVPAEEQHGVFF